MKRTATNRQLAEKIAECAVARGEKRKDLLATLIETPQDTFDGIVTFQGPFPAIVHGRDFLDTNLPMLLQDIVRECPEVFLERSPRDVLSHRPFLILDAAISLRDDRFTPLILSGLRCRSIYAKMLVFKAIRSDPRLRTKRAKDELNRLLTLKSIREQRGDYVTIKITLEQFDS